MSLTSKLLPPVFGANLISYGMTTKRAIIAVLLAAGLLLILAPGFYGCGKKKPNILLITLDTTRADHLRCYGDQQIETPGLNELARNGILFEHAYSVAPLTLPAHLSTRPATYSQCSSGTGTCGWQKKSHISFAGSSQPAYSKSKNRSWPVPVSREL